jgi:hypothetical protein
MYVASDQRMTIAAACWRRASHAASDRTPPAAAKSFDNPTNAPFTAAIRTLSANRREHHAPVAPRAGSVNDLRYSPVGLLGGRRGLALNGITTFV